MSPDYGNTKDNDQLDRLNIAAMYLMGSRSVRRGGWWGLGWGIFLAAVTTWELVSTDRPPTASIVAHISLALGILMIITGVYMLQSRKPWTMLAQGLMLGALAVFHLVLVLLELFTRERLGGSIVIVLFLGAGSMIALGSYGDYSIVSKAVDTCLVPYVDSLVQQMTGNSAPQAEDLVTFIARPSEGETTRWRVLLGRDAGLFIAGDYRRFSKKIDPSESFFAFRKDILLERTAEKRDDNEIDASLHIMEARIDGVVLNRMMFDRFHGWLDNDNSDTLYRVLVRDSYMHNSGGQAPRQED